MFPVVGVSWAPFDVIGKAKQEGLLTNTYVEAFRRLAPDMGAYVNEVGPLLVLPHRPTDIPL